MKPWEHLWQRKVSIHKVPFAILFSKQLLQTVFLILRIQESPNMMPRELTHPWSQTNWQPSNIICVPPSSYTISWEIKRKKPDQGCIYKKIISIQVTRYSMTNLLKTLNCSYFPSYHTSTVPVPQRKMFKAVRMLFQVLQEFVLISIFGSCPLKFLTPRRVVKCSECGLSISDAFTQLMSARTLCRRRGFYYSHSY